MQIFVLSRAEIEPLVDYREIIDVVEQSFADYNSGKAVIPPVTNLDINENSEVHIKSGHIDAYRNYCIKIASSFRENQKRGLPVNHGVMVLSDAATGELTSLLFDKGYLSHLRTAAAGAIAAKYLAKKKIMSVGVIGTGTEARLQVIFLPQERDFQTLHVWGPWPESLEQYKTDMQQKFPEIEIVAHDSPSGVAKNADLLVTATPSRSPLIKRSDLHPGLHVTALGSDSPPKQEISADAFTVFDKVVVDHLDQCSRLGELHHALDEGTMTTDDVHAEIGEVIIGTRPGREHDDEITLCDLTGVAVQDIAISNWAMQKAQKNNLGKTIEL